MVDDLNFEITFKIIKFPFCEYEFYFLADLFQPVFLTCYIAWLRLSERRSVPWLL